MFSSYRGVGCLQVDQLVGDLHYEDLEAPDPDPYPQHVDRSWTPAGVKLRTLNQVQILDQLRPLSSLEPGL